MAPPITERQWRENPAPYTIDARGTMGKPKKGVYYDGGIDSANHRPHVGSMALKICTDPLDIPARMRIPNDETIPSDR